MKYIRTKDGRIVDIEKFINEEKDTPYYKDFIFEEITKDGVLKWTAVGTEQNSMEEQRGIRCQFSATLTSEIIEQANTIEELCDEFIVVSDNCEKPIISALPFNELQLYAKGRTKYAICYGAIWTDKGLIYVAKMNDKGELELL